MRANASLFATAEAAPSKALRERGRSVLEERRRETENDARQFRGRKCLEDRDAFRWFRGGLDGEMLDAAGGKKRGRALVRGLVTMVQPIVQLRRRGEAERVRDRSQEKCRERGA